MSSYDYLTGAAHDPRDNVGKVRKMGHPRGFGANNPNNPSNPRLGPGIGDLIYQGYGPVDPQPSGNAPQQLQTPGPMPASGMK